MSQFRSTGKKYVMRDLKTDELVGQRKIKVRNAKTGEDKSVKTFCRLGTTEMEVLETIGTEPHEKLAEFLGKKKREFPKNTRITHGEAFDTVMKQGIGPKGGGKPWAPSTKTKHKQLYNKYARDLLGNKKVIEITKWDIIEVLERTNPESKEYFKKRFELSQGGRRCLYVALSCTFTMMKLPPLEYTAYNPVNDIGPIYRPPLPEAGRVEDNIVITDNEAILIAEALSARGERKSGPLHRGIGSTSTRLAYSNRTLFELLMESGMRITEALALELSKHVRYPQLHVVGEKPVDPSMLLVQQRLNTNTDEEEGVKYKADEPSTWFVPLKGDVGRVEGQQRRIPLEDEIAEKLGHYIRTGLDEGWLHEGGLLFPNTRQRPILSGHFWTVFKDAAKRAGIKRKLTTHYTRHSALSAMVENLEYEEDMDVVAEVAGHALAVLKKRYGHRREDSRSYDKIRDAQRRRRERRVADGRREPGRTPDQGTT